MRLGIDARILQTPIKNYGIGIFSYNWIKNIIEINKEKKVFDLIFYVFKDEPIPSIIEPYKKINLNRYKRVNFFFQQFINLKGIVDIFYMPMCLGPSLEIILPIVQVKRTIVTVYDLTFYKLKDSWSQFIKNSKEYKLQIYALKKVQKIIAVSNYTKKDLINTFSIPEEKIEVVYPGIDHNIFKPIKDVDRFVELKKKYNITKRFILCVGSDYKKNIPTLLKVIKEIDDMSLVVVGDNLYKEEIKKLHLEEKVIFTGPIPIERREELVLFYNFAEVLLFPSIAEGFGLPIIEAMACGCPVITSNAWSLPEVVGDAGIILSPYDIKGMVDTIKKIIKDDEFKKSLISKGFNRAKEFSWEKGAQKIFNLYLRLVS